MAWVQIQEKTFTRWTNNYLKERGMKVNDLIKDLHDGIYLINLLEVISDKSLGRHNKHPRIPPQKLENCNIALAFLKAEGIKLVNIGGEDIVDCKPKLILGLIWTIILRYQVSMGGQSDSAKNALLEWVRSKIPKYDVKGFTKDWNDGRALCALVEALEPGLCPNHWDMNQADKVKNCQEGIDKAHTQMGIPVLIDAADLANPKVDEQSVMTYISYFRDYENQGKKRTKWADKCLAYGPGLVEGVVGDDAPFVVEVPAAAPGKLVIVVDGPSDKAPVTVTKNGEKYDVVYKPSTPGDYKVSVTLDGDHIPGSVFKVTVLEQLSLGGEGKIRVYYSTTNASDKARSDVKNLQTLLERKGIHLRPDFEPWIPVDLLDRREREELFNRAQTRVLPLVFVDEKYVGDYDRLVTMEENGELMKLLALNEAKVAALFAAAPSAAAAAAAK